MKLRLDDLLVNRGIYENKSKARANIMMGNVIVNNEKIIKPGTIVKDDLQNIRTLNTDEIFVSRAGMKLFKAVKKFNILLKGKVCLDIGSSTGGFTDCCLQEGCKKVYAIDVGTAQLIDKLRRNEKVISIEKFNFRNVTKDMFDENIDFFCCDVSFISLKHIFPPLDKISDDNITGVVLIKPQFESSREEVNGGKITNKISHANSIINVQKYGIENNFFISKIDFSPILGNKKKNIEYIAYMSKNKNNQINENDINDIVDKSWEFFKDNQYEKL